MSGDSCRSVAHRFGLSPDAVERHWRNHAPRMAAGAAGSGDGLERLDVIDGTVLLASMARVVQRAQGLLDNLEDEMTTGEGKVDRRAVVAALREVRQSLVDLAKLNDNVRSQQAGDEAQSEVPSIDAAIVAALQARDVPVDVAQAEREAPWAVPALPAGPPS